MAEEGVSRLSEAEEKHARLLANFGEHSGASDYVWRKRMAAVLEELDAVRAQVWAQNNLQELKEGLDAQIENLAVASNPDTLREGWRAQHCVVSWCHFCGYRLIGSASEVEPQMKTHSLECPVVEAHFQQKLGVAELAQERDRFKVALESIYRHQKCVAGDLHPYSETYRIAEKALGKEPSSTQDSRISPEAEPEG
jgi:hypothetical protein